MVDQATGHKPHGNDASEVLARLPELANLHVPVSHPPFPLAHHPNEQRLLERSRQWTIDSGLMSPAVTDKFFYESLYSITAFNSYPRAQDEVALAIADFYVWFFVWDDQHALCRQNHNDRWPVLSQNLHDTTDSPASFSRHRDPIVRSLSNIFLRTREIGSEEFIRRFIAHFHAIIDAYTLEYEQIVPDSFDDHLMRFRRYTMGSPVWIDYLELGCELPRHLYESDAYQHAAWATLDWAAVLNDLLSLGPEFAAGSQWNACTVITRTTGCTLQEAVDDVATRLDGYLSTFASAEAELREHMSSYGPAIRNALDNALVNMRAWFPALYRFQMRSHRYMVQNWTDPTNPSYWEDLSTRPTSGTGTGQS